MCNLSASPDHAAVDLLVAIEPKLEVASLYTVCTAHLWRLMPAAEVKSLDNCRIKTRPGQAEIIGSERHHNILYCCLMTRGTFQAKSR